MPSEQLLVTLLRALQSHSEQQDTSRLLGTAISLYSTLNNPLNISLLTYQLLTAPALWQKPEGLKTSLNLISVFHSSVHQFLKKEEKALEEQQPSIWGSPPIPEGIKKDEWVTTIVRGSDERSQRWKHMLILTGFLVGFGPAEDERLSHSTRQALEQAFTTAANLALVQVREENDELGAQSLCLAMNHAFPLLSDFERSQLNYNILLPILVGSTFFSKEGLHSSYFIAPIDYDTKEETGKLKWASDNPSFDQVETTLKSPLISSLGPLSRLIAHSAEHAQDPWLVQTMVEDLKGFSVALVKQWRHIRFSRVTAADEKERIDAETAKTTVFQMWRLLRSTMFAIVIILRGAMGRLLQDRVLAADDVAPLIAAHTLHILRNLYFISSRLGTDSFTQYTFTYLTAVDVLARYPERADELLQDSRPMAIGSIPEEPLERCLDLFFLNTAEHFTLILSPRTNEELLVASAVPYLAAGGASDLLPNFEAAHSVMLAVMSAPQSASLTAKHLPFYIDALFAVFPSNLSPRQFRLAFKTLLKVLAPPSELTAMQPDLPATLLELLHYRALNAATTPLQQNYNAPESPLPNKSPQFAALQPLSEQAVLVLTLLDSLPFLPFNLLEEWLPLAAELVHAIPDVPMRTACQKRFWEVIIEGEMDAERSQICVAWWSTFGGRELVLYGPRMVMGLNQGAPGAGAVEDEELMMSGALKPEEVGSSKL